MKLELVLGILILVEQHFRFIVRGAVIQVLPQILLLEAVVAVVNMLLILLTVREQTLSPVKPDILLCEDAHGLDHLLVQPEIKEKPPLGVDEVVDHSLRNLLQAQFRLEDQTVQRVHRCRRHLSIISPASSHFKGNTKEGKW